VWSVESNATLIGVPEITVDVSQPPFCVIRHPNQHHPEDFEALFEHLRAVVAPGSRWAVLVDLERTAPIATAGVRESVSKAILKNIDFISEFTVCEARVTSRPLMRGVLTVIDWTTPRPWPVKNFGSGVVAENWLRARLLAAGIAAPERRVWDVASAVSR
jgi:hypothetical protein